MYRPLNWFVVSISLLVLLVNYRFGAPVAPAAANLADANGSLAANPFAYVLEDGSEVPVPVVRVAAHPIGPSAVHQQLEAAVFTWSAPLAEGQPIYQRLAAD